MPRLLVLLALPIGACLTLAVPVQAQRPPGYVPPPAPYPGAPPYARGDRPGGGPQAYNQENCGTPDEPKPCPPLPKVPLQYYPGFKY